MRQVSFEFAAKSAGFRKSSDVAGMREAAEKQSRLGSTDNGSTELNAKSREGIPAVLPSLQASGACEAARAEPLRLLDERVLPERRREAGRATLFVRRQAAAFDAKQQVLCWPGFRPSWRERSGPAGPELPATCFQ